MQIEILRKIPLDEFIESVRFVPLMEKAADGSQIFVYKNAEISLREMHPDEVNPTSFYLIRNNLEMQRNIYDALQKKYGVDSLHLDGALEIKNENGEVWTFTPPIIEMTPRHVQYQARDGEISYPDTAKVQIPIINDGLHRVATARNMGTTFNGIFISGASEEFPFYAHPNEWDRVKIFEDTPKTKAEKKFYSRENCYGLYRNFDVLGCGKPRGVGK